MSNKKIISKKANQLGKIKNASQKIIKENPNYNKFKIKDEDLGSATFNLQTKNPTK